MKTLTIKLKQHTPLIHFQHDQEGATLRASEVKPKLDRFILSKLGRKLYYEISDDEFEEVATSFEQREKNKSFEEIGIEGQEFEVGIYIARKKKWIVTTNGNALDYKMRIQIDKGSTRSDYLLASYINNTNITKLQDIGIMPINNSPYFAQEKENREIYTSKDPVWEWKKIEKKGIYENGTIDVTLLCLNKEIENDLFDYLSTVIQSFFISTNFGTRQSKGFGSFTVKEIKSDDKLIPITKDEVLLKQSFQFVYKNNKTFFGNQPHSKFKKIFSNINDDYKLLKSGRRGFEYSKSKVMLYANETGKKWDKRFIKRSFNSIPNNKYRLKSEHNSEPSKIKEEYLYYRALLGLAEQFEFLLENPPSKNSKMIVKVSNADNSDIQRYQSPLLFKVIDNNIYLVGNEVCKEILGKSFNFQIDIQKDDKWAKRNFTITTPSSFNLKDFMRFAMGDDLDYTQLK